MDPVSSTTFIKRPPLSSRGEEALFLARDTLLNRLFLGNYVERRHVGEIMDYRDVIIISTAESELISDLNKIQQRLSRDCAAKWVGITSPGFENAPNGYCLWVKLSNIPFGQFWFQIKQIERENEEIIFKLKCIRPVRLEDYKHVQKDERENCDGDERNFNEGTFENAFKFDLTQKLNVIHISLNEAVRQIRPHLTWKNFLLLSKFTAAMVFVLVSAMITCIQYVGEYLLRLIRETAFLMETLIPVLVQAIDCITKTTGGLFLLIVFFFRTRYAQQFQNQTQPLPRNSQMSSPIVSESSNSNIVSTDWRERNRALKRQLLCYPRIPK